MAIDQSHTDESSADREECEGYFNSPPVLVYWKSSLLVYHTVQ